MKSDKNTYRDLWHVAASEENYPLTHANFTLGVRKFYRAESPRPSSPCRSSQRSPTETPPSYIVSRSGVSTAAEPGVEAPGPRVIEHL